MSTIEKFIEFCDSHKGTDYSTFMHLLLECIRLGEIKTIKVEGCEYEVSADILEGNG